MLSKAPKIPKDYVICQDWSMSKRFKYELRTRGVNRYISVTGIRVQDIKVNGPNFLNKITIRDCGKFEQAFYKENRKFRKFAKKYFKYVHEFIRKDKKFNLLRYQNGRIKSPMGVWVDLGGFIEYPFYKNPIEFVRYWWNYFKKVQIIR